MNFYVGGQEYIIADKNGTHHIFEVWDRHNSETGERETVAEVVFSGPFEKCWEEKDRMLGEFRAIMGWA